jgi:hypothetical protein
VLLRQPGRPAVRMIFQTWRASVWVTMVVMMVIVLDVDMLVAGAPPATAGRADQNKAEGDDDDKSTRGMYVHELLLFSRKMGRDGK